MSMVSRFLALCLLAAPTPALAYMGPGLGVGAISVALGITGSLLLGLLATIWYPLKRLFRRFRRKPGPDASIESKTPE